MNNSIIHNYNNVCKTIHDTCSLSMRNPLDISLIAVTKTHPPETITHLLQQQHTHFGENRVQEAALKWPPLKNSFPHAQLHLIGPLQSNKAKQALELFDFIHTVDRPSLVLALAKAQHQTQKKTTALIQINTGYEPQKAGTTPENFTRLLELARQHNLLIQGVMCIPPLHQDPEPHFQLCLELADNHSLPLRSFGMSCDFKKAISSGSTLLRVGAAIFGQRQKI